MKRKINAGTTSLLDRLFVRDVSQTASVKGLTGLTASSPGLKFYYCRAGDSSSTAVPLTPGTLGTWSTGGLVAVDPANMPGVYEIGIPNAAVAPGSSSVVFVVQGAANTEVIAWQLELDAVNYQNASAFLTGVNGLAPPTNWNATAVDASGRVQVQVGTSPGQLNSASGKVPVTLAPGDVTGPLPANVTQWAGQSATADANNLPNVNVKDYNGSAVSAQPYTGTPPTAASIATAVLTDTADTTTAGSLGYLIGHAPAWYTAPANADPWATPLPGLYGAGTAGNTLGTNLGAAMASFTNLFVPGVVTSVAGPGQLTVQFAGSAPPALSLAGLWCMMTAPGRAPEKQPILSAAQVDATHLTLTLTQPFATLPVAGDTVVVG